MNKQTVYGLLEEKMLGYTDYAGILVEAKEEPFVPVPTAAALTARHIDVDMFAYTGKQIYVRECVLQKLEQAANLLIESDRNLQLEVVYGYRALEVQQKLFEQQKSKLVKDYSNSELLTAAHRLVAVPAVAGHPAGAAVDIQILKSGKPVDFGTQIWEFVTDSYTFSPFVSRKAWDNRQLLRQVMMKVGFAPFDGEWWHFSYGDKEWAKYYGRPAALYGQEEFKQYSIT